MGRGYRRVAVFDVAMKQKASFKASDIRGEVEAHPAMDGRSIHPVVIGMYLGSMAENGFLNAWREGLTNARNYRVRGFRVSFKEAVTERDEVSVSRGHSPNRRLKTAIEMTPRQTYWVVEPIHSSTITKKKGGYG